MLVSQLVALRRLFNCFCTLLFPLVANTYFVSNNFDFAVSRAIVSLYIYIYCIADYQLLFVRGYLLFRFVRKFTLISCKKIYVYNHFIKIKLLSNKNCSFARAASCVKEWASQILLQAWLQQIGSREKTFFMGPRIEKNVLKE